MAKIRFVGLRSVETNVLAAGGLTNFNETKSQALLALGKIAEKDGDQEIADVRYTEAAAIFIAALNSFERPEGSVPGKRELLISQSVFECYEALGTTQQAKVWSNRVKQLRASEDKDQAD